MLHVISYVLYFTCYMLRVTCYVLYVDFYMLQVCLHVWRNRLKGGLSDLDVTSSRPRLAIRHIRFVLLVNTQKSEYTFVAIDLFM